MLVPIYSNRSDDEAGVAATLLKDTRPKVRRMIAKARELPLTVEAPLHTRTLSLGLPLSLRPTLTLTPPLPLPLTLTLTRQQLSGAARMKSIKPVQERVQLWYGDNDQMKNAAVGNL